MTIKQLLLSVRDVSYSLLIYLLLTYLLVTLIHLVFSSRMFIWNSYLYETNKITFTQYTVHTHTTHTLYGICTSPGKKYCISITISKIIARYIYAIDLGTNIFLEKTIKYAHIIASELCFYLSIYLFIPFCLE